MPILLFPAITHIPSGFRWHNHLWLHGFQLYAVENWIVARTIPVPLLVVYTGNLDHVISVDALAPDTDDDWTNAISTLRRDGARPKDTEHGTIMATSLAHFRSDFTIVHIPKGDFLAVRDHLYTNINLRRMHCSGRSALTLEEPSDTTKDRFLGMYHLPALSFPTLDPSVRRVKTKDSKNVFATTVLELVKVIQASLDIFGLYDVRRENTKTVGIDPGPLLDGLLCDVTIAGLEKWLVSIGGPCGQVETLDPVAHPSIVSALLSQVLASRNKLAALAYSLVPKDPFLHPSDFRVAIGAFVSSTSTTQSASSFTSPSTWTLASLPNVAHNLPLPMPLARHNFHLRSLSSHSVNLATPPPQSLTVTSLPLISPYSPSGFTQSSTPMPPLTADLVRAIDSAYDAKLAPNSHAADHQNGQGNASTERRTAQRLHAPTQLLTGIGRSLGGGIGNVALNIHSFGRGLGLPLPLTLGGGAGVGAGAASVLVPTSDMAIFAEAVRRGAWGAGFGHSRRRSSDGVVGVRRKKGKRRVRGDDDDEIWTGDEGDVDGEGRLTLTLGLLGRPSDDRGRDRARLRSPGKAKDYETDKDQDKEKLKSSRSVERAEAIGSLDDGAIGLGMVRGLDGVAGSVRGLWSGRVLGVVWLREVAEGAARDRERDRDARRISRDGGKGPKLKEKKKDKAKEKDKEKGKEKGKDKEMEKDKGTKKEKNGRWRERWTLGVVSDGDVDDREGGHEPERARSLDQVRDDEHRDYHDEQADEHDAPPCGDSPRPPPLSDDDVWPNRHRSGSIGSGFSGWRKIGSWTHRHIPDSIKSKRGYIEVGPRKRKPISRLTEIVASGSRATSPSHGTGHDRSDTAGTSNGNRQTSASPSDRAKRRSVRVQTQSPTLRPVAYGAEDDDFLSSGQASPVSDILDPDALQHYRLNSAGGKGSTRGGTMFLDPVAASSALTLFLGSSAALPTAPGSERELTAHERKLQVLKGLGHPTKRPWGNRVPTQNRITSWSDPMSARDAVDLDSEAEDALEPMQPEEGVVSGNELKSDVASGPDGEAVLSGSGRRKKRSKVGSRDGPGSSGEVIIDIAVVTDVDSDSDSEHDVFRMPRRRGLRHDAKRRRSFHDLAAYRDMQVLDVERMRIDVDLCGMVLVMSRREEHLRNVVACLQVFTQQLAATNAKLREDHHARQAAVKQLDKRTAILAAVDAAVARADQVRHETNMLHYESEQQLRVEEMRHNAGLSRQKVLELRETVFGGGGRRLEPGVHGAHGRFNRVQWTLDGGERLVDARGRTESEAEEDLVLAEPLGSLREGERAYSTEQLQEVAAVKEDEDKDIVKHPAIKPMWLLRFFTSWGANWGATASAPAPTTAGKQGDVKPKFPEGADEAASSKSARHSSTEPEERSQLSPLSVSLSSSMASG